MKRGDKIRIVSDHVPFLKVGEIFTVLSVGDNGVTVLYNHTDTFELFTEEFEIVE